MKFKSVSTFLTSCVLAIAASYTVSALAQASDTSNDNGAAVTQAPAAGDQGQMNVGQGDNASMPSTGAMSGTTSNGNSDDVTPDTATGDDDY